MVVMSRPHLLRHLLLPETYSLYKLPNGACVAASRPAGQDMQTCHYTVVVLNTGRPVGNTVEIPILYRLSCLGSKA